MTPKVLRRLVINATVARACGGEGAIHPVSKRCRDFLQAVMDICHGIVMTSDITLEWNRHQSNFARRWRVGMVARKKLDLVHDVANNELPDKVMRTATSQKAREAMLKDFCLIEAAMATDHTVVSLDEEARNLFAEAAGAVGELQSIVWVNPAKTTEQPIPWLENGAKPEKKRRLGF